VRGCSIPPGEEAVTSGRTAGVATTEAADRNRDMAEGIAHHLAEFN
jgi:hypothetical protein